MGNSQSRHSGGGGATTSSAGTSNVVGRSTAATIRPLLWTLQVDEDGQQRQQQRDGSGTSNSGSIQFRLPKYDKVYIKTTLSINLRNAGMGLTNGKILHLDCSNKGLVLSVSSSNPATTNDGSQQQHSLISVCKKVGSNYCIYKYHTPVYDGQLPSNKKLPVQNGKPLKYLYATVTTNGEVYLNTQHSMLPLSTRGSYRSPSFIIDNGPKNSIEKSLLQVVVVPTPPQTNNVDDEDDEPTTTDVQYHLIASWKYQNHHNHVEVFRNNNSGSNNNNGGSSSSSTNRQDLQDQDHPDIAFVFYMVVLTDLLAVNANMNKLGKTVATSVVLMT